MKGIVEEIERERRHVQLLAEALASVLAKTGMIRKGFVPSGPELLMFAKQFVDEDRTERFGIFSEDVVDDAVFRTEREPDGYVDAYVVDRLNESGRLVDCRIFRDNGVRSYADVSNGVPVVPVYFGPPSPDTEPEEAG